MLHVILFSFLFCQMVMFSCNISLETLFSFLHRWMQGYGGQELFYIDRDVICYQCGRNTKIMHEDGTQTVFAFQGNGVGPFAVHKINKTFAIAERCINPKIFVYNYPSLQQHVILEGKLMVLFPI